MNDWFTIDQIDKETYIISEYRHWEKTHCYLLNGSERGLLIDTGLGICDIAEHMTMATGLYGYKKEKHLKRQINSDANSAALVCTGYLRPSWRLCRQERGADFGQHRVLR